MNWLAHLQLSAPDPGSRLGHLLADLLTWPEQAVAPEDCQDGMRHHRAIDAFTDEHPQVRQAIARLPSPWRRYGGVLTDLYFDHLLARDFARLAGRPLAAFAREAYEGWRPDRAPAAWRQALPPRAQAVMAAMATHDLLGSYAQAEGVSLALSRMGRRLRRPVPLEEAWPVLQSLDGALEADFHAFWPALRAELDAPAWRARQAG